MRIALISDIHGNLPALERVLGEIASERVDKIICLGDVVAGPQPHEALEIVRRLECPVIMGNWDARSVTGMPPARDEIGIRLTEIYAWWAALLTDDDRGFIETFERTLRLETDDGVTLGCFHGSPRSFDDFIFASTPDEELAEMIQDFEASILIAGHTHLQMVRPWRKGFILNPGSVGQPFRQWWPKPIRNAHWAEYGIVDAEDGRLKVDLRRTPYDVDALLRLFRESGMPHADWWLESWSLEDDGWEGEPPDIRETPA